MTSHFVRIRPRVAGMSLIEVLVAILIFSVGATSLVALYAAASATHKRGVDRTHTALIAEEIFSEVQARYVGQADPASIVQDLGRDLPERIEGYSWSLILHRPGARIGNGSKGSLLGEENDGPWSSEELVVRVAVKWGEGSIESGDVYSTILLPRPVTRMKP